MIKKKFKENEVITLKLTTGEEIIGHYVSQDTSQIILRKPLVPVPVNEGSIGLAPYIMSSNYLTTGSNEIPFAKASIITMLPTSKEFADTYAMQVGGIEVPKKSLIM